jgi:hypothetical protein
VVWLKNVVGLGESFVEGKDDCRLGVGSSKIQLSTSPGRRG